MTKSNIHKISIIFIGMAVPFLVVGRVALAVAFGLGLVGLMISDRRREIWRDMIVVARSPLGMMAFIAIALWLPSMLATPMLKLSFVTWVRNPIFLVAIVFIWAVLVHSKDDLDLALKALLVAVLINVIPALVAFAGLPELIAFLHLHGWRNTDTLLELKGFAAAAMLLLPVMLWAGRRLEGGWLITAIAASVGLLALIWLTHNRSALAGILFMITSAGLLIMLIKRRPYIIVATLTTLMLLIVGVMASLHYFRGSSHLPDEWLIPTWLIGPQRQTIWRFALDLGWEAPWFGRGINVINFLPGADTPMPGTYIHMIPSHAHNWLIEVFVETGLIGASGLLLVVVALAIYLGRDYIRHRDDSVFVALMVHVGYWGSGLFNFSFWSAWWQVSYLLLMAFCLAARSKNQALKHKIPTVEQGI